MNIQEVVILCELCEEYAVKEINGFSFCEEDYLWFMDNVNPYQMSLILREENRD